MVIPLSRYFLGCICYLLEHFIYCKYIRLTPEVIADLKLWLYFLEKAHTGISINLVLECRPDNIFITDSYDYSIGSFLMKTGRVFWFQIPEHLHFRVSNNILEYLVEIIAVWLSILQGKVVEGSYSFSVTDSMIAIGWKHKSNFYDSTNKPYL